MRCKSQHAFTPSVNAHSCCFIIKRTNVNEHAFLFSLFFALISFIYHAILSCVLANHFPLEDGLVVEGLHLFVERVDHQLFQVVGAPALEPVHVQQSNRVRFAAENGDEFHYLCTFTMNTDNIIA